MKAKRSTVFKPIMLSLMVSGLMYGASLPQAFANDLDVYRPAVEGKTTLVLMLDTSGSMGACDLPTGVNISSNFTANSGTTPNYVRRLCRGSDGITYPQRITALQDAIFQLMDDPTLKDDVVMGVGRFPTNNNARIVVAAKPLTSTQRQAIKNAVAGMSATGGTPTAQAYAEAAAYLMGTSSRVFHVRYAQEGTLNRFFPCTSHGTPQFRDGLGWIRYCTGFSSQQSSAPAGGQVGFYTEGAFRYFYQSVGSDFPNSVSDSKNGIRYRSPLPAFDPETTECNGQGIYFLTDGEPNSPALGANVPAVPDDMMWRGAMDSATSPATSTPSLVNNGAFSLHYWPRIGEFSKWLFDKDRNTADVQIKTAVVGFGRLFGGIATADRQDPETGKNRKYYDCRTAANNDVRNACNWGEKTHPDLPNVGGFGRGGFYYAESTQEIVDSIKNFIDELKVEIPAVPTGAVVVPQDTLAPESLQPFAYLPLLEPKPGTFDVVWPGNVKKYDVRNGTVYGKNGRLVFNSSGIFADNTYDRWSADDVEDKGVIQKGGMFERLPVPTTTNSLSRNVWLQRSASSKLLDPVRPVVSELNALVGVTNWQRRYLLNFLGYNIPEAANLTESSNTLPATLVRPVEPFAALGGVVHSTPQLMTYSADLEEDGSLSTNRDESLLFGSLEGALHVVNAKTGVEQMAFIPRQILDNQARAFRPDSTGLLSPDKAALPTPTAFGVDAPWTAYAEYSRQSNKIEADFMYAYGGLRMGGDAFYGLDLTDRAAPKMLFNITPATSGFSRLGQTWGKPVVTRIRHNNQSKLVVIISGGYDMDYEKTDNNRSINTAVRGNAVYIVDAKTGERLLTVGRTGQGANLSHDELKFSVVGRVKTLDRDADGLTDHLYFADLGGQVFRVDLQNAPGTVTANFGTRVVRLANLTNANGAGLPGPRFYEAPVVTIHDEGSKRFALVNVASGDRSNPLYLNTTAGSDNRVYGIVDRDVARVDLYSPSITMRSQNIELNSLIEKPTTAAHKAAMLSDGNDRKNGWYYPLDAYGSIKAGLRGLKAYNEGAAIRNDLYLAVYNPSVINNGTNKCSAQVLGATELNRYCLPFGICDNGENRQRFNLGQGIQAVNFGPGDDPQSRRLVYQQPTDTVVNQETGSAAGQHRQYSAPPRLVPLRWHEKQPKLTP